MAWPESTAGLAIQLFNENAKVGVPAAGHASADIQITGQLAMGQQQMDLVPVFAELEGDFALVLPQV